MKATKRLGFILVPASFFTLVGAIVYMVMHQVVTPQMGLLLVIALFGCYVGFGILIAAYRLINKLN